MAFKNNSTDNIKKGWERKEKNIAVNKPTCRCYQSNITYRYYQSNLILNFTEGHLEDSIFPK